MRLRRPRTRDVRAAWWAHRALRSARRGLAAGEVELVVPAPPALPRWAGRSVEAVLWASRATCLEGSLVRQRWLAAHGVMRDVVIGVSAPSNGFEAHAWVDGYDGSAPQFHEIRRLRA